MTRDGMSFMRNERVSATARATFNYPERGQELRRTAWLDGLRGLAAFEVFIFHYLDGWMDNKAIAWGTTAGLDPAWYRFPFIRTFYASGDTAVCLFFAISGYVLSYRMLTLLRQRPRREEEFYTTLSSAVFRRGIRLYMPVVMETFALMIAVRFLGLPTPTKWDLEPTFILELKHWFMSFVHLLLPLRYPDRWDEILNRYDGTISWTIPLEYYGSLYIYTIMLLFSRTRSISVRYYITFALVFCSFLKDDWIGAQFLMGMAFADYQLETRLGPHRRQERSANPRSWSRLKFFGIFLFGFFLAGVPTGHYISGEDRYHLATRPFYDWISRPLAAMGLYADRQADRYLEGLAGICLLVGVGETSFLKRITELRFVQYLGRISFGLYLCHIFLHAWLKPLDSLYLTLVGLDPAAPYPRTKGPRFFIAYCLMMIPATAINFIVAGLFERYLDKPSIKAGKLFEQWCLSIGKDDEDYVENGNSHFKHANGAAPESIGEYAGGGDDNLDRNRSHSAEMMFIPPNHIT